MKKLSNFFKGLFLGIFAALVFVLNIITFNKFKKEQKKKRRHAKLKKKGVIVLGSK
jgi:hypothetical protein